jgi:hypothetical protein
LAGERLKFRCYQCSQLLASAPGKAGSIVSCPRCKAELVVPGPDSGNPADSSAGSVGKSSGRVTSTSTLSATKAPASADLDEIAAAIPADLIDLRPEDLRVEAEFFKNLTHPREPEPSYEAEPVAPVARQSPPPYWPIEASDSAAAVPPAAEVVMQVPHPPVMEPIQPPPWPATPAFAIRPVPDIPAIEIEQPSILAGDRDRDFRPVREVVLPASVVLAWSVSTLIGIATSFIAGLMLGHYFWKF